MYLDKKNAPRWSCSSIQNILEKRERGLSDGGPGDGSTEYARGPKKGASRAVLGGLSRGLYHAVYGPLIRGPYYLP